MLIQNNKTMIEDIASKVFMDIKISVTKDILGYYVTVAAPERRQAPYVYQFNTEKEAMSFYDNQTKLVEII